MRVSIVMATKNKANLLDRTLASIRSQEVGFEYEVVVIDDGSTDNTLQVCQSYDVDQYEKLINPNYRNPSVARNVGYKKARGDIVIAQSDDVMHESEGVIEQLCYRLLEGQFLIATVFNYNARRKERNFTYTGFGWQRPFFFLGSLWRRDLYAIGGCDEEFVAPGFDDDWFGQCLLRGRRLEVVFANDIIGHHQQHPRPNWLADLVKPSMELYRSKVARAEAGEIPWIASGGPWEYV